MNQPIVIVDDDQHYTELVCFELRQKGFDNIRTYLNPNVFFSEFYLGNYIVLLDYQFDDVDGISILKKIKARNPNIHVIMMSSQKSIAKAVETVRYGAFDYIEKDTHSFTNIKEAIERVQIADAMARKMSRNEKLALALKWLSIAALVVMVILYK